MKIMEWVRGSALVAGFREDAPGSLFAGVEKPTTTIAKMLVIEMLQNVRVKPHKENTYSMSIKSYSAWFPSFTIKMIESGGIWSFLSCELKDCGVGFDASEQAILIEGWRKFWHLHEAFRKSEAETRRQEQAIDYIANVLKVGASDGNIHETVRAPNVPR